MHFYRLYGLNIQSELELPECVSMAPVSTPDVTIVTGTVLPGQERRWYQLRGASFVISIPDCVNFEIDDGTNIIVDAHSTDIRKIRMLLLGSAFAALLMQRGTLPFHGSVLALADAACMITGESGAGKSTLAHALVNQGYKLVSDDVAATTFDELQRPIVHSAYPQQKLWPSSLEMFNVDRAPLQTTYADQTKYRLPVAAQFYLGSLPLRYAFQLKIDPALRTPQLVELRGANKLQMMLDETYRPYFAHELGILESHFHMCSKSSKHVRAFRISKPTNGIHPAEIAALVINTILACQSERHAT